MYIMGLILWSNVNTQLATIKLKTTQQGNDHLSVDNTKEIEFPFLTEVYNKIMQH